MLYSRVGCFIVLGWQWKGQNEEKLVDPNDINEELMPGHQLNIPEANYVFWVRYSWLQVILGLDKVFLLKYLLWRKIIQPQC